ncbi:MAG: exo-alpha-sialidase, partial [Candidatus Kapabacteria bacterium]|nr:exo-alpha-sialidase [Candidatus Kapabacteria bacterium]
MLHAQPTNGPWQSPLRMAWSSDGRTFSAPTMFRDSSGVPSAVLWKGDALVCAFQWFRAPRTAPTWDRVAVKFSYDAGLTWTEPTPIVVQGMPLQYQRPFDPT